MQSSTEGRMTRRMQHVLCAVTPELQETNYGPETKINQNKHGKRQGKHLADQKEMSPRCFRGNNSLLEVNSTTALRCYF